MPHKHITPSGINEIAVLRRLGMFQKNIAKIVGVTPSAISQEISRNKDLHGKYHVRHAKEKRKKEE